MKGVITMARKKKEVEHFQVVDGKIIMEEKDIENLTEKENTKISFYVKTLGYEVVFLEPEPKKKNYFTIEKAEKYLKKNDKSKLKTFNDIKNEANRITEEYKNIKKTSKDQKEIKDARKKMITAQREAFIEQKEWFKDTYGIEEYDKVRKEY